MLPERPASISPLDIPLNRVKILSRIRRAGTEQDVWQGFCSQSHWKLYKEAHEEFREQIARAIEVFYATLLKDDPELHILAVKRYKEYLENGQTTISKTTQVKRGPPVKNEQGEEEPGEVLGVTETTVVHKTGAPQWAIERQLK